MTIKQAIELLEAFNKWRRGAEIEMPNPKEIGQALDIVIDNYKNCKYNQNFKKTI